MTLAPIAVSTRHVDDLDRCVQRGIAEKTFSAAACVASVQARIFHRQVQGNAQLGPPIRRLGHAALFDLGALSMPLGAGLAALFLVSRNRLELTTPVGNILRDFARPPFDRVTLDMLLDHTSGLPASAPLYEGLIADDQKRHPSERLAGTAAAAPYFREKMRAQRFVATPGTKTVVSELGFMCLGWALEQVVGKPLDTFLHDEIYRPLGVHDELRFVRLDAHRLPTAARPQFVATRGPGRPGSWRAQALLGEVDDPNAWALGGVAGHAGLFGSASAVWRVCQKLLLAYLAEDRFFHIGTVARFWTRSRRVETSRTLGWDTPTAQGLSAGKRLSRTAVGHTGEIGTSVWIDVAQQVIGVLLTNAAHPSVENKAAPLDRLRGRAYDLIAAHAGLGPPPLDEAEALAQLKRV